MNSSGQLCPRPLSLAAERRRVGGHLDVDAQRVGPRLAKRLKIAVRLADHQVDVQRQLGRSPNGLHDRYADTQIGDEMPVHHVQMEDPSPRFLQPPNLALEMAEVARQ